jgi:hypothetical protein
MASPLLKLSERDPGRLELAEDRDFVSSEYKQKDEKAADECNDVSWEDGRRWEATRSALEGLRVLPVGSSGAFFLSALPQLLRLPTEAVVGAAELVCSRGGGPGVLAADPRLLAYRPDHVDRGLSFLVTMTASPAPVVAALCQRTPALLAAGIEGGLQEQSVAAALGSAAVATSKATTTAVTDAAAALKQLRAPKLRL